ncbi:prevent-host-death family protein [Candidatus Fervidibacteria bacterium JGI MDM2 JNZ-1-D12]
MVKTLSASEAKNRFGALIRRIMKGREYVIVEKDGIPVMGIMPAEELKRYLERRKLSRRKKGRAPQ